MAYSSLCVVSLLSPFFFSIFHLPSHWAAFAQSTKKKKGYCYLVSRTRRRSPFNYLKKKEKPFLKNKF